MEAGLSDYLVLVYDNQTRQAMRFWFEIKGSWCDWGKQSRLQQWNIRTNRKYGFYTAWAVGDEVKEEWTDSPMKLQDYIKKQKELK
jgi:hypothetical protein